MKLCVVREAWRAHPLAWIHRGEAVAVAAELQAAGHSVRLAAAAEPGETNLLRLSDPVMLAGRIARRLGSDWAARVDFILESGTGRLFFLECDVAPLIGKASAFTESLSVAGVARSEQLRLLLEPVT